MTIENFKSGFVSIIGRSNVGKSTLLNTILGEKVSIITAKPQTTRNRITGIKNLPDAQIVFWDTPGIHKARDLMNRVMVRAAVSTISEVDIILFMIEADKPPGRGDEFVLSLLKEVDKPVFLVINKIDLVNREALLPLMDGMSGKFPFTEIIPVSAKTGEGVGEILDGVEKLLNPGPKYFPEELITDRPERFIVSEMIREKIYELLKDEVPYSTAVEIEGFEDREEKNLVLINALIYVERDSQKRIIIGKRGGMIKKIGTLARSDIEALLGAKVFLDLFVKVRKGWSGSERMLRELGVE